MDSTTLIVIAVAILLVIVAALWIRRISWGSSAGYTQLTPRARPSVQLDPSAERQMREMVANGQKIEAIKRVRELTGLGLKEAKDYVESLPPAAPTSTIASPAPSDRPFEPGVAAITAEVEREARAILARGNKIEAIKRVRELTGLGLKEAKDYVETLPAGPPPIATSTSSMPLAGIRDDPQLRASLERGNKIEAIKRVRELTGLGLKEAKDYVESLPTGMPVSLAPSVSYVPQSDPRTDPEVRALMAAGHKIQAIKRVRELTGMGLKEAKDLVEGLDF